MHRDGRPDGERREPAAEDELQDGGRAPAAGLRQRQRTGPRQQGPPGAPQQHELTGAPPRPEPRRPEPVRLGARAFSDLAGQHPQLLQLQHRLAQRDPQHQPQQPPQRRR